MGQEGISFTWRPPVPLHFSFRPPDQELRTEIYNLKHPAILPSYRIIEHPKSRRFYHSLTSPQPFVPLEDIIIHIIPACVSQTKDWKPAFTTENILPSSHLVETANTQNLEALPLRQLTPTMPTKLQSDENLLFLYTYLKTAEFKNLGFFPVPSLEITQAY